MRLRESGSSGRRSTSWQPTPAAGEELLRQRLATASADRNIVVRIRSVAPSLHCVRALDPGKRARSVKGDDG